MYNSSYGKSTHEQAEQNTSSSSSQGVNVSNEPSSSSGQGSLPGSQYDLSILDQLLAGGVLQLPVPQLPGNSGPVHGGRPSYEHTAENAVATPSFFQGGSNANLVQPTQSSVNSGQTGQATSFVGQPPTCPPNFRLSHPDISARPDARGIPGPLWELFEVKLDYRGGDYAGVYIVFKKRQVPMPM